MPVETGLGRIAAGDAEALAPLAGKRLGLLAHPASVDRRLRHAREVLAEAGSDVRVIFGPEHGYGGEAQDMEPVPDEGRVAVSGSFQGNYRKAEGREAIPEPSSASAFLFHSPSPAAALAAMDEGRGEVAVHSLYGAREADLAPTPAQLAGLDAVVADLQDVGSRYYTFVWTAVYVLRACARAGIPLVVLDRPNPLGGVLVEGAPQRAGYRSFVGVCDVAVRHGMTIGELCTLAARADGLAAESLHVVRMRGWQRAMDFEDTGLPWVLPSPNMPTLDTVRVYPGGCLLEGTNLSEGRGTTRPFEIWGAPFLDGAALARHVEIDGATLRPLSFTPTFHKHAGKRCGGVQVHVTDRERFRPYEAHLRMIAAARRLSGDALRWRTEAYEFVSDRPAIDLLTGGPEYRALVDCGGDLDAWLGQDRSAGALFAEARREHLLY